MKVPDGWRAPALVGLFSFCAGVQLAAVLQMLTGAGYLDDGAVLKLLTLILLPIAGALLLSEVQRRDLLARLRAAPAALPKPAQRPAAAAKPPPTSALKLAPPPPAPRATSLRLTLETPLTRGPVWPPGEPLPVTVQAHSDAPLPPDLDIELELRHEAGTERLRTPLRGSAAVLSQTVPLPGPFTVVARALLDGRVVAEASAEGLACSYREEIGRRFEDLKARCAEAGLPVGADSTPREVRDALVRRNAALRKAADELTSGLEVALYDEDEVGRETYEAITRALADVERRGLEARAHA